MKKKTIPLEEFPTIEEFRAERNRLRYNRRYKRVLRSTIYTLVVVAAVAVLVATIWMPVLQIYGASMAPTLEEGDIVVSIKGSDYEPDNRIFVLGDHRTTSVDSRNTAVGCIADEQIVGKIVFRVWPLNMAGTLE